MSQPLVHNEPVAGGAAQHARPCPVSRVCGSGVGGENFPDSARALRSIRSTVPYTRTVSVTSDSIDLSRRGHDGRTAVQGSASPLSPFELYCKLAERETTLTQHSLSSSRPRFLGCRSIHLGWVRVGVTGLVRGSGSGLGSRFSGVPVHPPVEDHVALGRALDAVPPAGGQVEDVARDEAHLGHGEV